MEKKQRTIKSIRRAIISAVIILILLILAGLIYTWYTGKNVESSSINIPVKKVDNYAEVKTVKPAENVPESVAVQSFTDQVLPGTNAAMSIRTKPDSTCKISVIYNEVASVDSGLIDKTADEYGMVSWSWSVESSAPLGKWPVKVTCYYGEQWAVGTGDLKVVSEIK
jgi:hypothetical protein